MLACISDNDPILFIFSEIVQGKKFQGEILLQYPFIVLFNISLSQSKIISQSVY